ncbi:MAG: flavin reductase family protein [Mangrovicoccus sp.]
MTQSCETITPAAFWRALGERAIGACLVTAQSADGPKGFLGLSAAHISADPARMSVSVGGASSALPGILESRHFAINILSQEDQALAEIFGGKGEKPFEPGKWDRLATGAPVLKCALAVFDCALEKVIELDGTALLIGQVQALSAKDDGAPLIYFRGGFLAD